MNRQRQIIIFIIIFIMISGMIIWFLQTDQKKPVGPIEKITFATTPSSFVAYSIYIAIEKGYFRDEGLDVTLKDTHPHGKATLHALVAGETEFAVSSETPFMHTILDGNAVYAIAVTITAEKHLAIVARKDRGILKPEDLEGKKIGVTLGTNSEYFLDMVLVFNGLTRDMIKPVNIEPTKMFNALMSGEVDAIATWNPQMHKAKKELGDRGSVFYAEGLYYPMFIVAARKDYVDANPEIIRKVVRALMNASEFIRNNKQEANNIAARYLKTEPSLLNDLSATYDFEINLDRSLLLTLELGNGK